LELLDFKVSEQSYKDRIKVKHRNGDGGREGLDRVEFKDTDDWFKRVRIGLRNVSGKPIIGMEAYLYFRLPDTELRFRVRLSGQTEPRQTQPLDPGAETELSVTDQSWARTANILAQMARIRTWPQLPYRWKPWASATARSGIWKGSFVAIREIRRGGYPSKRKSR
jgi:hypothetical protein